jgi:hemerythrin-like domain-containing protein
MNAIDLMVEEHRYIKRMLSAMRKLCINILNDKKVDFYAFEKVIDFIRNFADHHHHSKEEEILFKKMIDKLDEKINREPIHGMFVEHDYGRLYIRSLEEALERVKNGDNDSMVDIIANAISYTHLLHRHIHKEDNAIYKFAQNNLNEDILNEIEDECRKIECIANDKGIQKKYAALVEEIEKRV